MAVLCTLDIAGVGIVDHRRGQHLLANTPNVMINIALEQVKHLEVSAKSNFANFAIRVTNWSRPYQLLSLILPPINTPFNNREK